MSSNRVIRSTSSSNAWSTSSGITRGGGGRRGGAGTDVDAHALQHELRLVLGHGRLECDVARREPHLLVAALVLEAGLVACVRFVEAAVEVHHRGAVDILDEEAAQIGHLAVPDHRSEPLDRADASERRDERLGHALFEQVRRLRDVRVVLGPRREREVEQRRGELRARAAACHASIAGPRFFVRGDT